MQRIAGDSKLQVPLVVQYEYNEAQPRKVTTAEDCQGLLRNHPGAGDSPRLLQGGVAATSRLNAKLPLKERTGRLA